MKKKVISIVSIVLAVVLIIGGCIAYAKLPHPLNYDIESIVNIGSGLEIVSETDDEVTVKKSEGELKVLMFTDIHLDGNNKTSSTTIQYLVNNIYKEKPDLVILGGDNVTSIFNRKRSNQLAEIFERFGVYWAAVLGNHEGCNGMSVSRKEMVDIFSSYDHCLMKQGKDGVWGNGNYALNILKADDTIWHTFYFLDTGSEMSDDLKKEYNIPADESPYDGAKASQVQWYTSKNYELLEKYGDFESTLVVHIPLPQMKEAAENTPFLYGGKLEGICASGFDAGLFKALKAGETTKSVYCGHDHVNDFGLEYDGVLLSYIQSSGYGSYTTESKFGYEEKDWLQGYTKLTFARDGSCTAERLRNSVIYAEK